MIWRYIKKIHIKREMTLCKKKIYTNNFFLTWKSKLANIYLGYGESKELEKIDAVLTIFKKQLGFVLNAV